MSEIKININPVQEIDWLIEAATEVATSSESDFTAMQSKKWYKRLWETITFSKDNQIRTAKGVSSLAKLQDILARVIVTLSKDDATISEAVKQNSQLIRKLSANDRLLQKKINKIIYGGRDEIDFSDLPKEKQIILANLLAMADFDAAKNDESRRYMNAVLSTAGISGVDDSWDYSVVESLSLKEQELLYRLILTNRHLLQIDPNKGSKILDYIAISSIRRNEIWGSIQETAQIVSPDFFASLYENTNDDYELLDDYDIDFDETCLTDENEDVVTSIEDFEEITISNIVHIQPSESRVFRHKIIHMQAIIHCEGSLEFNNCVIHYGEQDVTDEIKLTGDAFLAMRGCTIVNHSYDKNFFIQTKRASSAVMFENCEFINCCTFLYTNTPISMSSCNIVNPGNDFIHQYNGTATIFNCNLSFNKDYPSFLMDSCKGNDCIIYTADGSSISECTFSGDIRISAPNIDNYVDVKKQHPYSWIIRGNRLAIDNCSFFGLCDIIYGNYHVSNSSFSNCLRVICSGLILESGGAIEECRFDYCKEIGKNLSKNSQIRHCQFNFCFDELLSSNSSGGVQIEFCEFNNWEAPFSKPSKISQFYPAKAMLFFNRQKGKDSTASLVENCTFNGITAHQYFIIAGNLHEDIKSVIAVVKNCNFINCNTERESGKIIKEYAHYYNSFNARREIKAVLVSSDCRGIDRVNSTKDSTQNIAIKATSSTGRRIGIGAAAIVAGVPGWIAANILNDAATSDDIHVE